MKDTVWEVLKCNREKKLMKTCAYGMLYCSTRVQRSRFKLCHPRINPPESPGATADHVRHTHCCNSDRAESDSASGAGCLLLLLFACDHAPSNKSDFLDVVLISYIGERLVSLTSQRHGQALCSSI